MTLYGWGRAAFTARLAGAFEAVGFLEAAAFLGPPAFLTVVPFFAAATLAGVPDVFPATV